FALLGVFQHLPALVFAKGFLDARRQLYRFDAPVPAFDFLASRRAPGGFHRRVDAVAEDGPVLVSAVVGFAGRDVAAAAGEINLKNLRLLVLAFLPRQATEIAADPAVPVVAHRMRGVITQRGQRLGAVPEAQRL